MWFVFQTTVLLELLPPTPLLPQPSLVHLAQLLL
jgi:hypothetical protein